MRILVSIVIFFSFFDLFSQLPIMSPLAQSIGASAFITGLVVGIYSFGNVLGNVISGFMTDKRGPFLILLIGLFTSAGALFLYNFASAPGLLLGIRLAHGFMEGLIVPAAFTFLANRAKKEERGSSVAVSGAFIGLAAIIGPAYSGIVASKTSAAFIMNVNGILFLILSVSAFFILRSYTYVKNEKPRVRVRYLFQHPSIIRAFSGAFFLMFSQGVLALVLPLKVTALGYDTKYSGMLLSVFGVVAVLVFLLPVNKVFDRVRPMYTLAFGISLMAVSMLLLSTVTGLGQLFISMIPYGIGFAFLFPSINSLLIDATEPDFRGKAYGYFYAFFSIGVVAGSTVIGWLDLGNSGSFMLTGFLLLAVALYTIFGLRKTARPIEKVIQ